MTNRPGIADHAAPSSKEPLMSRIRKFLVAAAGTAAMVLATGTLEEDVETWVNAGLALLTAFGVYQARNTETAPRDPNVRA